MAGLPTGRCGVSPRFRQNITETFAWLKISFCAAGNMLSVCSNFVVLELLILGWNTFHVILVFTDFLETACHRTCWASISGSENCHASFCWL